MGFLIDDEQLIELPNRADKPHESFRFIKEDVGLALEANGVPLSVWSDPSRITLWHTHPRGGIGPSRTDMVTRVRKIKHLVVSLISDDGVIATWY